MAAEPARVGTSPRRTLADGEIGGEPWRLTEGTELRVELVDGDGHHVGTVHVPYDPDSGESVEEAQQRGLQSFTDMQADRSLVPPEEIRRITDMITGGAEPLAAFITRGVADAIEHTITPRGDSGGLPPDTDRKLAEEMTKLLAAKVPDLVETMAATPIDGLTFWESAARDIAATALREARDDAVEDIGGADVARALTGAAADQLYDRVIDLYDTGPYLERAFFRVSVQAARELAEKADTVIARMFEDQNQRDPNGLVARLEIDARKRLGIPVAPVVPNPRTPRGPYLPTGSDFINRFTKWALITHPDQWEYGEDGHPLLLFEEKQGWAVWSFDQRTPPAHAWEIVGNLDDRHADILDVVVAKMLTALHAGDINNPAAPFALTPEELYLALGYKKKPRGGYERKIIQDLARRVGELSAFTVQAEVTRADKRGSWVVRQAPLIIVQTADTQLSMTDTPRPIAWVVQLGMWAIDLGDIPKQYAYTLSKLLQIGIRDNGIYVKRIGGYLTRLYRINARHGGRIRIKVRTLLDNSRVPLPANSSNRQRFIATITSALNTLEDPAKMDGAVCIQKWDYTDKAANFEGRGAYDRWLDSTIEIQVPAAFTDMYKALRAPRKRAPKAARKR